MVAYVKTRYKGIYQYKSGTFFFKTYTKGKLYRRSASIIECAIKDKEIYTWAKNKINSRKRLLVNIKRGILVSKEDKYLLEQYTFRLRQGYASTGIDGKDTLLHKIILPLPKTVDHINRDKLDNRRENLRYCTISENRVNAKLNKNNISGYKGLRYRPKKNINPWEVTVKKNNKVIYVGGFNTKEEAIAARLLKSKELFGEFAIEETKEI